MPSPDLLLFADCETTGLPDWQRPADDPCQPRIASMAGILVSRADRRVISSWHLLIRPDGWEMPAELAAKVHGLTQERLLRYGMPIHGVLSMLLHAVEGCGAVAVFHNAHFDAKMLRIELRRAMPAHPYGCAEEAGKLPTLCTYKSCPDECRRARGDKKLGTVYTWLTGKEPHANAHTAMADAMMVKEVFFGLEDKGVTFA